MYFSTHIGLRKSAHSPNGLQKAHHLYWLMYDPNWYPPDHCCYYGYVETVTFQDTIPEFFKSTIFTKQIYHVHQPSLEKEILIHSLQHTLIILCALCRGNGYKHWSCRHTQLKLKLHPGTNTCTYTQNINTFGNCASWGLANILYSSISYGII